MFFGCLLEELLVPPGCGGPVLMAGSHMLRRWRLQYFVGQKSKTAPIFKELTSAFWSFFLLRSSAARVPGPDSGQKLRFGKISPKVFCVEKLEGESGSETRTNHIPELNICAPADLGARKKEYEVGCQGFQENRM